MQRVGAVHGGAQWSGEGASGCKLLCCSAEGGGGSQLGSGDCFDSSVEGQAALLQAVDVQQRPSVLHRAADVALHAGAAVLHNGPQRLQLPV